MPTLYNLRLLGPDKYAIAKFDDDFNVEAVYELTRNGAGFRCSCPAGLRTVKLKPCKHQRMLPYMLGAVNTDRFFDPERHQWHQPMTADLHEITRESEGAVEPPVTTYLTEEQAKQLPDDPAELIYGFNKAIKNDIAQGKLATIRQETAPSQPSAAPTPATQAPPTAPSPNRPLSSAAPIVTRRI